MVAVAVEIDVVADVGFVFHEEKMEPPLSVCVVEWRWIELSP